MTYVTLRMPHIVCLLLGLIPRGFGKYLVLKTFSDKVTIMFKSEHDFFTSFLGAGEIKYNLVVSLGLKTTSFIFGSISLAGL